MNRSLKNIEYIDENGLVFSVIETEMGQSSQGIEYIFNSYPDEIFNICVSNIKIGLLENLEKVPILVFKDVDLLIEIERIDFEDCLDNASKYFLSYEMYEKCSDIHAIKMTL